MKIRSQWLTKLAAWTAVTSMKLLFATCRVKFSLVQPGTNPYQPTDENYLISMWHDEILIAIFARKHPKMAGLVSRHQDGSYLAEAMKMLNILPVRGSSKRGGAQAMAEMIEVTAHRHIAITSDGPQGPRHCIKQGIIFLASKTGRQIVPTAATCHRGWRFKGSWTDMLIPAPFTTIYYLAGEPLSVPEEATREQLQQYAQILETRMETMQLKAMEMAGHNVPAQHTTFRKAA